MYYFNINFDSRALLSLAKTALELSCPAGRRLLLRHSRPRLPRPRHHGRQSILHLVKTPECTNVGLVTVSERCKLLRKLHNASIKNPIVLVEVKEMSESKSRLVCVDYWTGVSDSSLDLQRDRVRASCSGLVCCSSVRDRGVYYVCNPMTREFKVLPRIRERHVSRFHPDGEAALVGIACDLAGGKFNVVLAGQRRRFSHNPDAAFMCAVYDSESRKWRKFVSLQVEDEHFSLMSKNQAVCVKRALHWLTERCTHILVLDLERDAWLVW